MEELLCQPVEVLLPDRYKASHPAHRNTFVAKPTSRPMGAGRGLRGRRKGGSEFDIENSLNQIQTAQGMFIASAVRDITEHKRIAAELE